MARRKRRNKKGNVVSVDFTGVDSGGFNIPEDQYRVGVDEVEQKEGESSGEPYLAFKFKVSEGKHKGSTLFYNCSLQPQALFNLRGVLEALGYEVEDGEIDIDLDELVGLEMGVEVENETFRGKKRSQIVDVFSLDEDEEDEEDEDDEDDEEEEEDEDLDEEDEEDEEEEEEPPRRRRSSKKKGAKKEKGKRGRK